MKLLSYAIHAFAPSTISVKAAKLDDSNPHTHIGEINNKENEVEVVNLSSSRDLTRSAGTIISSSVVVPETRAFTVNEKVLPSTTINPDRVQPTTIYSAAPVTTKKPNTLITTRSC